MSRANKCDRCGIFYEDDIKFHGNDSLFLGRRPYNNDFLDLCPMCQKSFESWFAYPARVAKKDIKETEYEIKGIDLADPDDAKYMEEQK
ncbi:MAG: hypothetical protein J6Y02_13045 [Pseudobutyrivibrio sp.]|nr:hypothetical protein [Pseudobutyrivibrio sp.]